MSSYLLFLIAEEKVTALFPWYINGAAEIL